MRASLELELVRPAYESTNIRANVCLANRISRLQIGNLPTCESPSVQQLSGILCRTSGDPRSTSLVLASPPEDSGSQSPGVALF